ncbi:MAG TPA: hypothetical protein VK074_13170, partial [Fodinibius sp.]|nr:hypothetical protein [Fodinibius sp.]
MQNPLLDATDNDESYEQTIRPTRITEFIGQQKVLKNLSVFIRAAQKRKEALDHVILSGPPGLGK